MIFGVSSAMTWRMTENRLVLAALAGTLVWFADQPTVDGYNPLLEMFWDPVSDPARAGSDFGYLREQRYAHYKSDTYHCIQTTSSEGARLFVIRFYRHGIDGTVNADGLN